ncbi:MAG TPA: tetratricopeptide repeat protein, partial [Thiotrichales bacterium]|nr:tetratricopeptide repeat protein [Thiotrichales bacterium]
YHADLAHRRGNRSEYIASLKRLYTEKSSAKTANIIAYALEKQGKFAEAEQWHRKSFSASDDPAYALAYGNSLLRNVRLYKSIGIFRRVVKNKKSTEQQREYAYSSMANAYLKKKQYQKADEAWEQAFAKSRNPVHILHRVVTNNLAERFDVSYRLISTFGTDLPSGLPEEFHNDWYAAAGKVYFKNKKYADSQAVLKKLVARAPSANHYLLLADSYRAAGDTRKADAAYLHAARFAENEGSSLIERAYIHKRAGNDAAAEQLFLQALKASPDNAQASEELGYISLADHRNQEAADYFKAVLDEHEKRAQKEHDDNDLKNKQENLNSLIATLEDKWTFSFHDSFCLGGKGCESGSEGVISPFGQGFGQAEITYRPDRYGYRNGRELLIFSRLLWRNKADTFLALKGSQQATVGVRYKPVARQNFWVSAEYMPELGSDTEEHILLRTAWSKTSGNDWRLKDLREFNGYRFKDYTNLYVDAGKLFKNTDPFLVYAEGRKGKTMLLNRQNLLSGFGYLRGSFEFDNDSSNVVDAGIGIEARYRNRFDRYHGYQTEWSLLFGLGQEIINSQSDKDSRANLGISVHF